MLAFGMMSAVLHARATGQGQVVDAAMVDGVGALMTPLHGLTAAGLETGPRGTNLLDSGAPFYDVYRCADGEYVSLAPIEAKFQQVFIEKLAEAGVNTLDLPAFDDKANWPKPWTGTRSACACAGAWRRSSKNEPARSGAKCSKAATAALRPCSRRLKHPDIRTTPHAATSSRLQVSSSRRRRRVSAPPRLTSPSHPGKAVARNGPRPGAS